MISPPYTACFKRQSCFELEGIAYTQGQQLEVVKKRRFARPGGLTITLDHYQVGYIKV